MPLPLNLLKRTGFYYYKQNKQQRCVEEFRDYDNPVAAMNEVNEQIAKAKPLTDEELAQRDELLQQGFPDWKRLDFHAFIRACETFGRKSKQAIVDYLSDKKDAEDVSAYYRKFQT